MNDTPVNVTMPTELQAERDRLRLLLEITNLLVSHHDLGDLFHALSTCISRAIPHEYASVSLYEGDETGPAHTGLAVLDGVRNADLENRPFVVSEQSQARFALSPAITYDIATLQANNPTVGDVLAPHGLVAFCSVHLLSSRRTVGILSVASRNPAAFDPEQVSLLVEACGQIAIAIENGLAYEEIRRLRDQLLSEKRYLEQEIRDEHGFHEIIGGSAALLRMLRQVDTVADTDATVLILGETGTGKELIARAIHGRSQRRAQSFVKINCAAIPPALIESEMFGHERGAFTGAIAARAGRFEVAHRGTLFLDEIAELPIEMQPKLLRVVQEREIERVGSSTPTRVDVRLIAATNRDLESMVRAGTFREDLFYRLNVFPVQVPALRERRDDIPALVAHFVHKHATRLKRSLAGVPEATMEALRTWDWPGNIRELENVIERAVILATDGVLRTTLPVSAPVPGRIAEDSPAPTGNLNELDVIERDAILRALRAADGIVGGPAGAAARLGLKRTTLQSRMQRLGIGRPRY